MKRSSSTYPTLKAATSSIPMDKQIAGSSMQRVGLTEAAPHSWSETDATSFQVRVGPDYNKNKLKAASLPALFELVSVDIYSSKMKVPHITGKRHTLT